MPVILSRVDGEGFIVDPW